MGEVQLAGVAGHQACRSGPGPVRLGPENPPQPLGFFLPRAERARTWIKHVGVGQIDGEVADLRQDQMPRSRRGGICRTDPRVPCCRVWPVMSGMSKRFLSNAAAA